MYLVCVCIFRSYLPENHDTCDKNTIYFVFAKLLESSKADHSIETSLKIIQIQKQLIRQMFCFGLFCFFSFGRWRYFSRFWSKDADSSSYFIIRQNVQRKAWGDKNVVRTPMLDWKQSADKQQAADDEVKCLQLCRADWGSKHWPWRGSKWHKD